MGCAKIKNPANENVKHVKKQMKKELSALQQKHRSVRCVPNIKDVPCRTILTVNTLTGDDLTGKKGDKNKPFKTIEAALAVAVCGDTIYVEKGEYLNVGNLKLKNKVNFYFEKGAVVRTGKNFWLFRVVSNVEAVIYGQGTFYLLNHFITSEIDANYPNQNFTTDLIIEGYNFIYAGSQAYPYSTIFDINWLKSKIDIIGNYFQSSFRILNVSNDNLQFNQGCHDIVWHANIISTPGIIINTAIVPIETFTTPDLGLIKFGTASGKISLCCKHINSGHFLIKSEAFYVDVNTYSYRNTIVNPP